ncbi:MAG: SxtJ family membrane protein [Pirellulales bacterium]
MALLDFNRNPSPREVRQFALYWLSGFCCLLAAWAYFRYGSWTVAVTLGIGAVASMVLGLLRPMWMRIAFLVWMGAAYPIGWLISHTLLAAIYYLVITPIGALLRLSGRDPLARRFDRDAETYWTSREPSADPARYFRQF